MTLEDGSINKANGCSQWFLSLRSVAMIVSTKDNLVNDLSSLMSFSFGSYLDNGVMMRGDCSRSPIFR